MYINKNCKILKKFRHRSYFKKIITSKIFFHFFSLLFLTIFLLIFNLSMPLHTGKNLYAEESGSNAIETNDKNDKSTSKNPFIFPLKGHISVCFREQYFDEKEKTTRKHTGIDIAGEFNQDVLASGNGIVSYIGISPIGGRTIVIRHNEKIRTTYLNLLKICVYPGEYVHQGDVIGTIGSEDDPSSLNDCHLHFGIIYDGFYLDPEDVLNISYKSISKYIRLEYLEDDFKLE